MHGPQDVGRCSPQSTDRPAPHDLEVEPSDRPEIHQDRFVEADLVAGPRTEADRGRHPWTAKARDQSDLAKDLVVIAGVVIDLQRDIVTWPGAIAVGVVDLQ
jgi:hypothetical protein